MGCFRRDVEEPWEIPGGPGGLQALSFHPIFLCLQLFIFFYSVYALLLLHRSISGSQSPASALVELVTFLVLLLIDLPRWKACFHTVLAYHPWSSLADDGIDVRLRGIKIKSSRQRDLGLSADMFQLPNLVRYPRLEGTDPDLLYRRAVLIQRCCMEWCRQVGWRLSAGIGAISSMSMVGSCKAMRLPLGQASWTLEKISVIWEQSGLSGATPLHFQRNFAAQVQCLVCRKHSIFVWCVE